MVVPLVVPSVRSCGGAATPQYFIAAFVLLVTVSFVSVLLFVNRADLEHESKGWAQNHWSVRRAWLSL